MLRIEMRERAPAAPAGVQHMQMKWGFKFAAIEVVLQKKLATRQKLPPSLFSPSSASSVMQTAADTHPSLPSYYAQPALISRPRAVDLGSEMALKSKSFHQLHLILDRRWVTKIRILYEKDKVCFPCFFFYSMLIAHQAGLAKVDIYLKGGFNK